MSETVGHINLDLQVNQKKFNNQLKQIQQTSDKTAGKMQSSFTSMAKKVAGVIAGAFAVKKIVDFSKECLELGSDLQEVQNVVDVTFPTMREEINQFAQSAAASFGLSETMAKKFTGTFGSMAKAFGFSEEQAAGMGKALTGLAGDVASFYNITQDEAYTKLKSVFTGETESLKDLGVVMTQTALDSFALANGLGKTTAQMSESEKVALRYKFVTNQLSAAQGDFMRTSDGWANQVRVLNLQVDSLKATIGQGLINLFTPVIKLVNQLLGRLTVLGNKFKELTEAFAGNGGSAGSTFEAAADATASMDASTGAVADNLKKANKFLASFDVVNKASEPTDSSTGGSGAAGGSLEFNVDTAGVEKMKKDITGLQKVMQKFEKFMNSSFVNSIKKSLQKLKEPIKDAIGMFGGMFEDVKSLSGPFTDWLVNGFAPIFATVFDMIVERTKFKIESFTAIFSTLWDNVLMPFLDGFMNTFLPIMTEVWSTVTNSASEMQASLFATLTDIRDTIITPVAEGIGTVISDLFTSFETMWAEHGEPIMEGIRGAFTATADTVKAMWEDTIKPVWEKFSSKISEVYTNTIKPTFDKFMKVIANLIESFTTIYTDAILPCVQWLAEKLEPAFDAIGTVIADVLDTAGEAFDGFLDVINGVIDFITGTFTGDWEKAWEGIQGVFAGIVNTISSVFTGAMNLVIKAINAVLKGINKLSFTVPDWVPGIGGEKFGFDIPLIKEMEVPKLAEGGYVRANAPQLALIGDNRHQGEVVAPEGKLLEMAKMAASMSGGDSAVLSRIVSLLEVLISIVQDGEDVVLMVGEEELARASARGSLRIKRRYTTGEVEFV